MILFKQAGTFLLHTWTAR